MTRTTTAIWKSFHGRLRDFIHRRIRNEHDADDILQDVFTKIHSGIDRLESPEKLEAWIFQVARRTIIDHYRKPGSKHRPLSDSDGGAGSVSVSTANAEIAACLPAMLESVSERDRDALRRTDLEGGTQEGLAKELGLSLTGVKSRVQRARKRLKEALLACCRIDLDRRGNVVDYVPRRECPSCD